MPIIRIIESEVIDRSAYEAVRRAIDLDHQHPLGLLMHAAGEVDGHLQIVNVWEAQEYAETFDQEVLEPAFQEITGQPVSVRRVTTYTVGHLVTP